MRLNQFVFFIASTVILGGFIGILTAGLNISVHGVHWYEGMTEGALMATNSLMGFWAFLMLNFVARIILPRRVWRWSQALLVIMAVYDMLWWRYHLFTARHPHTHTDYMYYFLQAIVPFIVAVFAAKVKERLSGKGSFLPTVFFLYVFTIADCLLVLIESPGRILNQTGIITIFCNVYMILIFGKLLSPRSETVSSTNEVKADPSSGSPAHI